MFIQPIPQVQTFVDELNRCVMELSDDKGLTKAQRCWTVFVLMGIVVTGKLCWLAYERSDCFGRFGEAGLRWIFKKSQMPWHLLLRASVLVIIRRYGISKGSLVIDDSEKRRSKNTKKIYGVQKVKDKVSSGFIQAQEFVFMVLVTDKVTIPVDFEFYISDPKEIEWKKQCKLAKKNETKPPKKPAKDPKYPSKPELALLMLDRFVMNFPAIKILLVAADALYGGKDFMNKASAIDQIPQVISQLKSNQIVMSKNKSVSVSTYFNRQQPVKTQIIIRGGEKKTVYINSARLRVKAHGKKRFVIALKYEGETEYRYIVATNLAWRHKDIVQGYSLRWLVEVFIEDWKQHGGWNRLTKHQGVEGSYRGMILSLMCDHLTIHHEDQKTLIENKQPCLPVGCVIERLKMSATVEPIEELLRADNPVERFDEVVSIMRARLPERSSSRHMNGRDLGCQTATESLKYREEPKENAKAA